MYAVVGCSSCGGYWLVSDPNEQESATCGRCGTRHAMDKLKRFHTAETRTAAAEARAALLAEKQGDSDAFESIDDVATLDEATDDAGVDDDRYLSAHGIDPDAVAEAGDVSNTGSRSRDEIVRAGVRNYDAEAEILEYATDHGVPEDAARKLLRRLVRRGDATESNGAYRLL